MQIIDVWTVHTTFNEWGTNGSLVGVYRSKAEADHAAKDKGWYGGGGNIGQDEALLLDDGVTVRVLGPEVSLSVDQAALDQQAGLAKLTPTERTALGLP